MRPNVDIDWDNHGRIKSLAEGRYDGDLDQAYNAVLKRGLRYSAIPSESQVETGDPIGTEFIPTENEGNPIIFDRFLGQESELYSVGHGPYTTYSVSNFIKMLKTVSQYDNVGHKKSSFGIRRQGGNWVGWGFGDLFAALEQPTKRYGQTEFTNLTHEEIGLVFRVGSDYVVIRGRHIPEDEMIGNVHLDVLVDGCPTSINSTLEAVLGEFGAEMVNATELTGAYHTGLTHEAFPVDPIGNTTYSDKSNIWVDKIMIENPFRTGKLTIDVAGVDSPEKLVVHLSHHVIKNEDASTDYWVENYSVTVNGVINVSMSGNWENTKQKT